METSGWGTSSTAISAALALTNSPMQTVVAQEEVSAEEID